MVEEVKKCGHYRPFRRPSFPSVAGFSFNKVKEERHLGRSEAAVGEEKMC